MRKTIIAAIAFAASCARAGTYTRHDYVYVVDYAKCQSAANNGRREAAPA